MNLFLKNSFVILFVNLLLCSCEKRVIVKFSDLTPVEVPKAFDSIIEIKNWLAFGPFEFEPEKIGSPVKLCVFKNKIVY